MTWRISGDILEFGGRGDAVKTPGKSLALEAHAAEPMAMKERSPMKESSGRPENLEEKNGEGEIRDQILRC